jgi:hypothetical protein
MPRLRTLAVQAAVLPAHHLHPVVLQAAKAPVLSVGGVALVGAFLLVMCMATVAQAAGKAFSVLTTFLDIAARVTSALLIFVIVGGVLLALVLRG